jgi:hypothetical protein
MLEEDEMTNPTMLEIAQAGDEGWVGIVEPIAKDSGSMLNIGTINAAENATVNITLNSTDKNKIVPVP